MQFHYFNLFALLLLAAVSTKGQASTGGAADIEDRWKLETPKVVYTDTDNNFALTYAGASSDNVAANNLRVAFYDDNCKHPEVPVGGGDAPAPYDLSLGMGITMVGGTDLPVPSMTANGELELMFQVDPQVLANNAKIYIPPSTDTDDGKVSFCTRMSVGYLEDSDGNVSFKEVNFMESIITIAYDLTNNFTVAAVNVAPKTKDTATGSKEYAVEAFLCDLSTVAAATANTIPSIKDQGNDAFEQGSLVTVCVAPDDASRVDGIVMKSINAFTWKRSDDATIQQFAIVADEADANELTSLDCTAQNVFCYFSSVLSADFYKKSGSVIGSGSATMEFGSSVEATGSTDSPPSSPLLPIATFGKEFDRDACGCADNGVDGPLAKVPAFSANGDFQKIVTDYFTKTDATDTTSSRFKYGNKIGCWDVGLVTNMINAFNGQTTFDEPLGCWNMESVNSMQYMFINAHAFNQDISAWVVSSVTNMHDAFKWAYAFNQDIGAWNVSSVTDMWAMFYGATAFNQDIGKWVVASVNNMAYMFYGATAFNQDISAWVVSSVNDMFVMFYGATAFNQDISAWDVALVTTMKDMFYNAKAFNQNLCDWDIQATSTNSMFSNSGCLNTNNPTTSNKCYSCDRRRLATPATATATAINAADKSNNINNNNNNKNSKAKRNIVTGRVLQEDATVAAAATAVSSEFDISIGVSKSDNNDDGIGALRTAGAGSAPLGMMNNIALISFFGGLIGSAVLFV